MVNVDNLFSEIQQIAHNTLSAEQFLELCFGVVQGVDPLAIFVDQRLVLHKKQLLLVSSVCNQEIEMDDGVAKKMYSVKTALVVGDKVLLLRMQGGQKYVVLSKLI